MLFSSISFLYYFLPIVFLIYFLVPFKFKNLVLLIASLFFYFYGEPIYVILMVVSSLSAYVHGLLIDKFRETKWSRERASSFSLPVRWVSLLLSESFTTRRTSLSRALLIRI